MKQTSTLTVIEYILQHEAEDYFNWCEENELTPSDVSNEENQKHVYASACLAHENETGSPINF